MVQYLGDVCILRYETQDLAVLRSGREAHVVQHFGDVGSLLVLLAHLDHRLVLQEDLVLVARVVELRAQHARPHQATHGYVTGSVDIIAPR